ncbi:nucleotidyltransferase [Vibrio phage 1.204.O._10N.222.46.F12]|uniref:Poly A polymerase head domain protein n=1 Tax=Vibrio phage 1.204.O._10N.222.46.F12 TaxID=1881263 RepID=A0A2I7RNN9_9CAUD|nr:nucleotidyltransferase [Vibrio phage 1.204.O._10N.222.46.F12]AUR95258.1 hypothetical protein NVP1204O_38 [Vibrio phage 1.204.O._10N.222.46.F12]
MSIKAAKFICSIFNTFKPGSAVIAGGYVRDLVTGRSPKDIDILVEFGSTADYAEVGILADRLGYTVQDHSFGSSGNYEDDEDSELRRVITLHKPNELTIDILFLNVTCMERIDNFPCNASMFWLDGDDIRKTDQAKEWLATNKLQFYKLATTAYIQRMENYFPECIR